MHESGLFITWGIVFALSLLMSLGWAKTQLASCSLGSKAVFIVMCTIELVILTLVISFFLSAFIAVLMHNAMKC